ncbi:hypothetical protein HDA32_005565 [Spinactinospora alkalitolerans]|uniref:Uncharacterized protein n=1 Tax=Spinactinospora alkalitolerans TaxID=687207 RepID=A0A852U4K0_9ACTN|nr:hypothetical protein [Spinactinospora alkalitolerans]NYE50445.1 hypothetical protein [Spinactinospora alkalitolerans]
MKRQLPTDLKVVRILLFVLAGLSAVGVVAALVLVEAVTDAVVGALLWAVFPGVLSLIFGLRLPRGGPVLFWSIAVLQALNLFLAVGNLSEGVQGITQMLIPILTLVFLLRAPSRRFFRERAAQ